MHRPGTIHTFRRHGELMGQILRPERAGGQGLDHNKEESGNRAILALLRDPQVSGHVDMVITYRDGAYEVWAARGTLRFQRLLRDGRLAFEVVERIGAKPLADCTEERSAKPKA
jgi:hypothetical protein